MRKQDLIRAVEQRLGGSHAEAERTVNAVLDAIERALRRGESVTIPRFGTFDVVERAARQGRNPQTGELLTIAPRQAVAFRPSRSLKEATNTAQGSRNESYGDTASDEHWPPDASVEGEPSQGSGDWTTVDDMATAELGGDDDEKDTTYARRNYGDQAGNVDELAGNDDEKDGEY